MTRGGALLALTVMLAAPAVALGQAGAYLPLDDPAYGLVDYLQSRGALRLRNPAERPYVIRDLRAALDSARADTRASQGVVRALARHLDELDGTDAEAEFFLLAGVRATAQSSGQRELTRADTRHAVRPGLVLGTALQLGAVTAVARIVADNRFKDDPEFPGRTDRVVSGRTEDGYVLARWRYAQLFAGRVSRNWAPSPASGLLIGRSPYSYDHLLLTLGVPWLRLTSLAARLSSDTTTNGEAVSRFLSSHRLSFGSPSFEMGVSESMVYGGQGRGFEPSLANPFGFWLLGLTSDRQNGNSLLSVDLRAQRGRLGALSAQLMLDDIQIDRCHPGCDEPASYGLHLESRGAAVGPLSALVSYTRVSNLAYRAPLAWERYTQWDVGLGTPWTDFDESRVGVQLPLAGAVVTPYFAFRRQGEGSPLTPYPDPAFYASTPGIFAGSLTRTARFAVALTAIRAQWGSVDLDVGVNRADADASGRATRFAGRARMDIGPLVFSRTVEDGR